MAESPNPGQQGDPSADDSMFDPDDDELFASVQYDFEGPPASKRRKEEEELNNNNQPQTSRTNAASSVDIDIDSRSKPETEAVDAKDKDEAKPNQLVTAAASAPAPAPDPVPDPFDDDDDEFLSKIADVMEESAILLRDIEEEGWVEDDGVEEENRFKTRIGRPHPLLMPEVLQIVFSNITCVATVKSCRQVCTVWKDVVSPIASNLLTLKNANHLTEQYPYGLGYSPTSHTFTCAYPVPLITRIRIADPCMMFGKKEVADFFRHIGAGLKYFGFDANFWCKNQTQFLENVLLKWCKEKLEEVELFGVSNTEFLQHDRMFRFCDKNLGIKRFRIVGGNWNSSDHHHYSSTRTVRYNIFHYGNRFDMDEDDEEWGYASGIVSNLIMCCPSLESVALNLGRMNSALCFSGFNGPYAKKVGLGRKLETLALKENVDRFDLGMVQHCCLNLKTLILGELELSVRTIDLQNLLVSVSETLEHLEVGGYDCRYLGRRIGAIPRLNVFRFSVSCLQRLKVLKIGNACLLRVDGLSALKDCLKEVVIRCSPVLEAHGSIVRRHLNRFFKTIGKEIPLTTFEFRSCDGIWLNHDIVAGGLRHHGTIRSLSMDCFVVGIANCVRAYSKLKGLEEVCLTVFKGHWTDGDWTDFPKGVIVWPGLKTLKILNPSQVWFVLKTARIKEFLGRSSGFYSLELNGFMIYDDEAEDIARYLADHVNFTRFTDCTMVKRGSETLIESLLWQGTGRRTFLRFTGIELSRVNVGMRVRELFHRL